VPQLRLIRALGRGHRLAMRTPYLTPPFGEVSVHPEPEETKMARKLTGPWRSAPYSTEPCGCPPVKTASQVKARAARLLGRSRGSPSRIPSTGRGRPVGSPRLAHPRHR